MKKALLLVGTLPVLAVPAVALGYAAMLMTSVIGGVTGSAAVENPEACVGTTSAGDLPFVDPEETPESEEQPEDEDGGAEKIPEGPIAGYDGEQLENAAIVMRAAEDLGLDVKAQVIGVMTAMGESSLVNIAYGDNAINPDGSVANSLGLFQQQDWWGTAEERMDPYTASTLFFDALIEVDDWESLEPTIAAYRVQRNADPYHYEKYFEPATDVVSELSGIPLSPDTDGPCDIDGHGDYPPAEGTEPGPWGGFENGRIPLDELVNVPWERGMYLRADAMAALDELDDAFLADFGYHLPLNDAYRDFDSQVEAKERYGSNAATPGTSNHGWGMAIDIGTQSHSAITFDSDIYHWLKEHAPAYGWVHPPWAEPDGAGPHEAWHWEFWGKAS